MRAFLLTAVLAAAAASSAQIVFTQGNAAPSLEGVWKGTVSVTTGAGASTNSNRQPNVIIYTKRHYSVVSQDASVPLPERQAIDAPKDANRLTVTEKLARYELWAPVIATAGEYELQGTRLTHRPVVAKGLATEQEFEVRFEGKDRFIQISKSGLGQPVSETRRTFVRVE